MQLHCLGRLCCPTSHGCIRSRVHEGCCGKRAGVTWACWVLTTPLQPHTCAPGVPPCWGEPGLNRLSHSGYPALKA